jgi:hypothetical protein
MSEKISDLIKDLFDSKGIRDKIDTASVQTLWSQTVGEIISKNTSVVSLKSGTITIKTINPVWRNELVMQSTGIIKRMNKKQNRLKIKEIRFI